MFQSLNSFLPEFKQSCLEMQKEIAETGTTHFAVEELINNSSSDSSSSSDDSSDSSSDSSAMSVEGEHASNPVVEMVRVCCIV